MAVDGPDPSLLLTAWPHGMPGRKGDGLTAAATWRAVTGAADCQAEYTQLWRSSELSCTADADERQERAAPTSAKSARPRTTWAAFRTRVPAFSGSRGLGRGARKTQTERRSSAGAMLNISPSPRPPPPQDQRAKGVYSPRNPKPKPAVIAAGGAAERTRQLSLQPRIDKQHLVYITPPPPAPPLW
jgi:hypothetical protein